MFSTFRYKGKYLKKTKNRSTQPFLINPKDELCACVCVYLARLATPEGDSEEREAHFYNHTLLILMIYSPLKYQIFFDGNITSDSSIRERKKRCEIWNWQNNKNILWTWFYWKLLLGFKLGKYKHHVRTIYR